MRILDIIILFSLPPLLSVHSSRFFPNPKTHIFLWFYVFPKCLGSSNILWVHLPDGEFRKKKFRPSEWTENVGFLPKFSRDLLSGFSPEIGQYDVFYALMVQKWRSVCGHFFKFWPRTRKTDFWALEWTENVGIWDQKFLFIRFSPKIW